VMAGISTIYERDVLLTYELTQVIIRTTLASNPYTTSDPSALLGQVQAEWNTNQQGVQRDVAHLWTGRNMFGSTIGIAFLGTICTGSAYGADQIRFTSNFNSRVGLFAHELGHNWNAPHCNGLGECRIMCSGLGGCNGLGNPVRFAPVTIDTINSFITGRDCIDQVGISLPIFENFEDQVLNPPAWNGSVGFTFEFDTSAPSGFVAGEFDQPFSSVATGQVETDVAPGNTVAVSMFLKEQTSGDGEIRVNVDGGRRAAFLRTGEPSDGYTFFSFQLPGSFLNGTTQISFAPNTSRAMVKARATSEGVALVSSCMRMMKVAPMRLIT